MQSVDPSGSGALRAGTALAIVVALVAGLLALVDRAARPMIERHERGHQLGPVNELLPRGSYDNDLLADRVLVRDPVLFGTDADVAVHRARRNGQAVAVLMYVTAPRGFGGPIELLIAVNRDGRLLGVRALAHNETAGLGDAIDTDQSDWMLGFTGRSLVDPPQDRWSVQRDGGDFDQFTGATITPRAVVTAVRDALVFFDRHRDELLAPPAGRASSTASSAPLS